MSTPKFAKTHNLVAFLEKPAERKGFQQIIDFLNADPIKYALTVNPTIYTSCNKQFWDTAKVKTINGKEQIQALVDKNKVIIIETSVRSDLQLQDVEGTECLPNATIFEQLTLMRRKQRKETEVPQNETQTEENVPTHSYDPLLSGEERLQLKELMELYTKLSDRVLDLETIKTAQAKEIANLKKRVKRLERKKKSRSHGLKRLYKVKGRMNEEEMFGVNDLDGDEVIMDATAGEKVEQSVQVAEKEVSTADPVTTVSEVVTFAAGVEVCAAVITPKISIDEFTLAKALIDIKTSKPKAKGIVMQELSETPTPTPIVSSQQPLKVQDKVLDNEVAIDAIPLATKPPIIVDCKIIKEGKISSYHLIKADGSSKRPEEAYERVIWDDLNVMFEPDIEKKRYPLTPATITKMLNQKLQVDY
uniref:Xylulose kinase-1 n=1 Tax=Tanacetum cinerariifolium TaxID=118510 RepID=A0A6L2LGJ0_TANCI|nr:hypothetical protein [Tanacetum cinerariifolium]